MYNISVEISVERTNPYLITNERKLAMTDDIILPPNSKAIPLTRGFFAIVDKCDYDFLNQWKWCCALNGYAVRSVKINGVRKILLMHRFINNTPHGLQTDHINGNKLDNRKENLRTCAVRENACNKSPRGGKSKFKGVAWHKKTNRWRAYINITNKQIFLGLFLSEIDAAKAYDAAAVKHHGEFARLNKYEN